MTEEVTNIINEIEKDVIYFKNLGFDNLAAKFERDLKTIKSLVNT